MSTELEIDSTKLDETAVAPPGRTCPACGAPLDELDQFCNACGTPQTAAVAAPAVEKPDKKSFRCENCGAQVATVPDQRSYVCPFCDSTYVVEIPPEETGRQPPEFVIGFAVTRDVALEKFHAWLADNAWFRPGDLRMAKIEEKLKGVYLPFWSFSMLAQSGWSARIGEYWYRTETYTTTENGKSVTKTRTVRETEWWSLAGNHHQYYSGYLVSGSRGLPQSEAQRIKPFRMAGLKRYAPRFLAGWLAEEYSVEREAALAHCRQEFFRREQQNVAHFLPGDEHRELRVDTEFSHVNSDLVLLPVYLLSYRYRERLFRFMVNGQTGKIAGDKPLSRMRVAAAVAVGILIAAAFGLTVFLLSQ